MRVSLLAAVALLAPAFAGCVSLPLQSSSVGPVELDLSDVPAGATVEPIENGVRLVWDAVSLPFEEEVTIPEGTTLVRLTGLAGPTDALGVYMKHTDTGRRRCNVPNVDAAWGVLPMGEVTCSGVTAIDTLPTSWTMSVGGRGGVTDADRVQVEFLTTPPDGLMAALDLTQLSQREFALEDTEVLMVESFDGAPLRVEVTLPKGEGPWPTILWSSPYNHDARVGGKPAAWEYVVKDWAERGYAVVSADVRGYGESGGCVEVWGENEQRDQAFLVDWVAAQSWSDGNVGFYGQSYVATTPVAAAVQAPEALKAIVIVAPVNNAYDDWHFGGVPNGENSLSPVGYYTIGTEAEQNVDDPLATAMNAANGLCDPTVAARGSDPRAVYDDFYAVRNFSARAGNVKAAVLYTQGFEDSNVKSQMIPDWFNDIAAPKLGLFGHWVHQHPVRADNEVMFLGWMDQYVKGKPVGFEKLPAVDVVTNVGTHRSDDAWPPTDPALVEMFPDFTEGALSEKPSDGWRTLLLDSSGAVERVQPLRESLPLARVVTLETEPLAEPLHVAGQTVVRTRATLEGAQNAYVAAYLYEQVPGEDEPRLVTWGMFNVAHRFGHDRYEPVKGMEALAFGIPMLPTEYVFQTGSTVLLELRGARTDDWAAIQPAEPARFTFEAGAEGTALVLPTVDAATAAALPATAQE